MLANYLAEVWGILIVIISLALLIKPDYLKILFAEVENNASLFVWGLVSLAIGTAMILAQNVWVHWQIIVTLLGWVAFIKGLACLFMPETVKNMTKKIENSTFIPYAMIIALLIGLVVTYFGFTA
jgi:uncharacterized protein YjeT (DUF2065 family)